MSAPKLQPALLQGTDSQGIPIWLRRLDLVKAEADAEGDVRTPEEGLRLGLELMAQALNTLRQSIVSEGGHTSEAAVTKEMRRLLAQFAQLGARWVARWQRERSTFIAAMWHFREQSAEVDCRTRGNAASERTKRATNLRRTSR